MEIRLSTEQDLEQILQLDRHIPQERLLACIREGWVLVLACGAQIFGTLRYNLFWQTVPFLDLLYLAESHRGQGWGSKMMAVWEAAMKEKGYPFVMLSTQADESAKGFYEKIGYRRIGGFLPPEQDAEEIMYLKEFGE